MAKRTSKVVVIESVPPLDPLDTFIVGGVPAGSFAPSVIVYSRVVVKQIIKNVLKNQERNDKQN